MTHYHVYGGQRRGKVRAFAWGRGWQWRSRQAADKFGREHFGAGRFIVRKCDGGDLCPDDFIPHRDNFLRKSPTDHRPGGSQVRNVREAVSVRRIANRMTDKSKLAVAEALLMSADRKKLARIARILGVPISEGDN